MQRGNVRPASAGRIEDRRPKRPTEMDHDRATPEALRAGYLFAERLDGVI
jgi:hypothetical protein